jgi:hypothetical protein
MTPAEARRKVENDPDFIALKRFEYSLGKLVERYPDGCPDRIIAAALLMAEGNIEEMYQTAVAKLRIIMGVTE